MTIRSSTAPAGQPAELLVVLEQDTLKIDTCFHCVVKERESSSNGPKNNDKKLQWLLEPIERAPL